MFLTKWYFDCVDDAGNICIAYWAQLSWKTLAVSYCAVMLNRGGATESRDHFFAVAPPSLDGDALTWSAAPLHVAVTMRRRAPAYEESLIDGVAWRCEMPSADAEIVCGDTIVRGSGYAERLQLDVAPWKLPIDELRWGRFAGSRFAVTWIDWRGAHPLTRIVINGERGEGVKLITSDRRVIRDALLGDTVSLPGLPKRITGARETKWCARATAMHGDDILERGWAVYELVKFA